MKIPFTDVVLIIKLKRKINLDPTVHVKIPNVFMDVAQIKVCVDNMKVIHVLMIVKTLNTDVALTELPSNGTKKDQIVTVSQKKLLMDVVHSIINQKLMFTEVIVQEIPMVVQSKSEDVKDLNTDVVKIKKPLN